MGAHITVHTVMVLSPSSLQAKDLDQAHGLDISHIVYYCSSTLISTLNSHFISF